MTYQGKLFVFIAMLKDSPRDKPMGHANKNPSIWDIKVIGDTKARNLELQGR